MNQQKNQSRIFQSITVLQRKHYGCMAKIFCCKCIHCCQDFDFSLLTSEKRKSAFQKMIKHYIRTLHQNRKLSVIMDPFFILVALLLGEESDTYSQLMEMINNQSQSTIFSKQDLQFYIPQLCTYLVFHEQLKNIQLQNLLVRACKVDIHFSLKYYFYMKSLQQLNVGHEQVRKYERVSKYNSQFRSMINHYYQLQNNRISLPLTHSHLNQEESSIVVESKTISEGEDRQNIRDSNFSLHLSSIISDKNHTKKVRSMEQTKDIKRDQEKLSELSEVDSKISTTDKIINHKIRVLNQTNIYEPFISKSTDSPKGLFESTVNFFSDLVELSKLLVSSLNRREQLCRYLQLVNQRLPANVYIPFTKDYYQDMNIINIVVDQARVFSTKERAPYYICMESFCNPSYNEGISKDKKIRSLNHIHRKNLKQSNLFEEESIKDYEEIRESQISIKLQKTEKQQQKEKYQQDDLRSSQGQQKKQKKKGWNTLFNLNLGKIKKRILNEKANTEDQQQQDKDEQIDVKSQKSDQISNNLVTNSASSVATDSFFGESEIDQFQRVSSCSPYSNLPGYKLIHIIVKSFDDLRQQSFAMQLLQQFDKIFKMQKLKVKLLPYEVLPLSHEAGIMECVRDAITVDQLRKQGGSLQSILNTKQKMKNFIYTLTGYSLITYLLQVKDRHNGNIMIRNDGCLFHIDYGFFMSNTPGKGVELQKNLPFKLTIDYVEALGGVKSKHFQRFRKLFYKAFNACRKHQHRILILTKLMYSSYGKTMPCFVKGDQAIQKLQSRFNPPGLGNDAQISVFCQSLINSSIDNWRSRWYDKWQYYVQGIFY